MNVERGALLFLLLAVLCAVFRLNPWKWTYWSAAPNPRLHARGTTPGQSDKKDLN